MTKLSTEEWIEKAKEMHGDKYNYSVTMYSTAKEKLKIICPIHGEQEMLPHHHIRGYGCGKCGKEQINISNGRQLTQEQFIEKVKEVSPDLSLVSEYTNKRSLVTINCNIHGDYTTKAEMILKGCGCPKCNMSKGESIIRSWLDAKNIVYTEQKGFNNCVYRKQLKFDFFLPEYNMCIEYNGKQHYEEVLYWGGEEGLKNRLLRDGIKKLYCESENINLLIIKYDEDIIEKLKENIK